MGFPTQREELSYAVPGDIDMQYASSKSIGTGAVTRAAAPARPATSAVLDGSNRCAANVGIYAGIPRL